MVDLIVCDISKIKKRRFFISKSQGYNRISKIAKLYKFSII